jgi:lysyl-tRNA synthetase class 1
MARRTESSWPFAEANKIIARLEKHDARDPVVFETGFGPSGLPHIGTFAEVARTVFVKNAFEELSGRDAKLYAFCDDMDGLRRVPKNLPNQEMLAEHLGRQISKIPDPFGCCASYSDHMEGELVKLLDHYKYDYQLKSSTKEYEAGVFNQGLHLLLEKVDEIREIILPTLQDENRENWSPFFPVCEKCGRIYTTRVTGYFPDRDKISYECVESFGEGVHGCGHSAETSIFNGNVKVGWKVDWALRWFSYNVAYEMYGKDLIDSARLSGKIERLLGGLPPEGMTYEMFLSEEGRKISKSVGEGLTIDTWLNYAPIESLLFYLFQNPKKQRRLYFDVIPKNVDEYLEELRKYPALSAAEKHDSAMWHIERGGGEIPEYTASINFSLVNNLISGVGADDKDLLMDYLERYDSSAKDNQKIISDLVDSGLNYFRDFIQPEKRYREPTHFEKKLLNDLCEKLDQYQGQDENDLQAMVFDVARENGVEPREFFKTFYQVILGQDRGPRFGTLTKLIGKEKIKSLIGEKINVD